MSALQQIQGPQDLGHIDFAEWLPDSSDRRGGTEALGVVARNGLYAPLASPVLLNGNQAAAAGQVLGGGAFFDTSGSVNVFFGDATHLYRLINNVANNVSNGAYALGTGDTWQFAQFGSDIIAVTPSAPPQVFTLGVSTKFANLGGSPPAGRCVGRCGDFLFIGHDNSLSWSGFNNDTIWGTNPAFQSDSQTFDNAAGRVMAIITGDYNAIFFENQIRRAVYAGPPVIWDFGQDAIEFRRGAISNNACVKVGRIIYYASDQGFYAFDGLQSVPIGENKVDNYFLSNLNYGSRTQIFAGYDYSAKAVFWAYPTGSSTIPTERLVFSLTDARWTHDFNTIECMFELPRGGYTVDNIYPNYFSVNNLDTAGGNISIDSDLFRDSRRQIGGVDTSHRLITFSGSPEQATIDTQEAELAPGRRCFITETWPMVDATQANLQIAIGYRPQPGGSIIFTPFSAMNTAGFCPQRLDSRFVRARMQIAAGAGWKRAEGVHFRGRITGWR